MSMNFSVFGQEAPKVRRSIPLHDELQGAQTNFSEKQQMSISNPEVLALIYSGADVTVDSSISRRCNVIARQ